MTNDTNVVRPLDERVAELRHVLSKTFTIDAAMVALSMADDATLREIEPTFYPVPAPILQLRETIAAAHVQRVAGKQSSTTRKVSPELVTEWAYGTLHECMPGWTDFDGRQGGQYVLNHIGMDEVAGGCIYRVTTPDGNDPKHFLVRVESQLLAD